MYMIHQLNDTQTKKISLSCAYADELVCVTSALVHVTQISSRLRLILNYMNGYRMEGHRLAVNLARASTWTSYLWS